MSPSQNGNDFHYQTYVFEVDDFNRVGEARRFAMNACLHLDFDETRQGRVGIAINELGNNLAKYANEGRLMIRLLNTGENKGIEILSVDKGPGFSSAQKVLVDGFSTGSTPGTGLGAVARQSDVFDIYSNKGSGTIVLSIIYSQSPPQKPSYNIGAISVPFNGESVCGDAWSVRSSSEELSAIMVDGLGHGVHANEAALAAVDSFSMASARDSLEQVLKNIHNRLKSTRGGAVFLARILPTHQVNFIGVGNIRAFLQTPEKIKNLISQNGTAGVQIRSLRDLQQEWSGEGFLVLHSDGLTSRSDLCSYPGVLMRHPAVAAAILHRDFSRGNDDATVLVIGKSHENK